jgi:hypothetical protein
MEVTTAHFERRNEYSFKKTDSNGNTDSFGAGFEERQLEIHITYSLLAILNRKSSQI